MNMAAEVVCPREHPCSAFTAIAGPGLRRPADPPKSSNRSIARKRTMPVTISHHPFAVTT